MFEKEINKHINAFNELLVIQDTIEKSISEIVSALKNGNKVFVAGNGGSAADANHLVAEHVWRFENNKRKALPFFSLSTNVSTITAIGNDKNFDEIFSRQVEALGDINDILISISTSGESKNIINAVNQANSMGLYTISLTGKNVNNTLSTLSNLSINFPSSHTPTIQEMHLFYYHYLSRKIDNEF